MKYLLLAIIIIAGCNKPPPKPTQPTEDELKVEYMVRERFNPHSLEPYYLWKARRLGYPQYKLEQLEAEYMNSINYDRSYRRR